MPPALAARFTQAEMAALRIISDEVRHHGVCGLHIDAIAARAGTCRTTVKNALRERLAASTWSRSRSAAAAAAATASAANKGYDLRLIQDYLGHRDPRHTVHYTRTASRRFEGLWR
jgi:hypothetical protein